MKKFICIRYLLILAAVIVLGTTSYLIYKHSFPNDKKHAYENALISLSETSKIERQKADAENQKQAEEAKKAEELKRQDEARKAEELKRQEEAKKAQEVKKLEESKKTQPEKQAETPAQKSLIEALAPRLGNSRQAMIVIGSSTSSVNTTFEVYEKDENGVWNKKWTFPSVIGYNGMSTKHAEGDGTSPMGIHNFLFMFGSAENPGVKMEYRKTRPGDYWISDVHSPNYNEWVHYDGDRSDLGNPKDIEDLYAIKSYKYAAALDYNYGGKRVIGKGSAIFLHIRGGSSTAGCVALSEDNLLKVLKWMDPAKSPKIVIGTEAYLRSLK